MAETRSDIDEHTKVLLEENNKKLIGDISNLIHPLFKNFTQIDSIV